MVEKQDLLSGASCSTLPARAHDYLLKFLLVGDQDVGKNEILSQLDDGVMEQEPSFAISNSVGYKTTVILLEGKRVKLHLWDTSGQGRFSTIIRSYSRGAQGILVVYDITNRWSFDNIRRWLREVDEQAPGIPKILIGNRLHLEFRRKVSRQEAQTYAAKNNMVYFEVSPLADFNIHESLTELARSVLVRTGMQRLFKPSQVLSLQELSSKCVVSQLRTVFDIDHLPVPPATRLHLKSFANSSMLTSTNSIRRTGAAVSMDAHHRRSGTFCSGGPSNGGGLFGGHRTPLDMLKKHRRHRTLTDFRTETAAGEHTSDRRSCKLM